MLLVAMASSGRVNTVSDSDNWENAGESPTNPLFSSHQGRGETFSDLLDGVKQKLQGKRREMLRAPFSINTLSSPAKKKKIYPRKLVLYIFSAKVIPETGCNGFVFFLYFFKKQKLLYHFFFLLFLCVCRCKKSLSLSYPTPVLPPAIPAPVSPYQTINQKPLKWSTFSLDNTICQFGPELFN